MQYHGDAQSRHRGSQSYFSVQLCVFLCACAPECFGTQVCASVRRTPFGVELDFLKECHWMTICKLIRLQILETPIRLERYFTTRCLADELFQVIYKGIKAILG
jgi:hypothetical protein